MDNAIVLGQKQNIPYAVPIVTQAWNELSGQNYLSIPATHLYVRFLPQSLEELHDLLELEDSHDLDFDLFPYDYETLQEGDFYQDPAIPDDQITWHYTVVPANFKFPSIQHEILEELILTPYFSLLTMRAYRIAGLEYDDSWRGGDNNPESGCEETCPNWPCCYQDGIPCENDVIPCDFCCDCHPGTPSWPECLEISPTDGGSPPTNECGCPIPPNPRFPAGCVRVADTQLGNESVKQVKVIVKNNFFTRRVTQTDEQGCFRINHAHGGKVTVKIKFKNDFCKIRAIRSWASSLWQYADVLTDKRVINSAPYNNLNILFGNSANENSKARALWYAATGNNALVEYRQFAAQDNIMLPHNDLNILLSIASTGEAAPMFKKINNPFSLFTVIVFTNAFYLLPGPPVLYQALYAFLSIWSPDIIYNHGGEGLRASDQVKESFYHEFAHASHFRALNSDYYWLKTIEYIILHGVYGDGTAPNTGRTAVTEMWGFHYGPVCADKKYGMNHSNTTNPVFVERRRHIFLLESFIPSPPPDPSELDWIPLGLFMDLIDNNALNPTGVIDGVAPDVVTGFTHANCFNAASMSQPLTVQAVRNNLIANFLPPGQTAAGVTILFDLYGF